MILCHKCAGVLARKKTEDTSGMMGCGCISGWVRGFEPDLNREDAIRQQIAHCLNRAKLYANQGRPGFENMDGHAEELRRLLNEKGQDREVASQEGI